jgi:hypothetical protein
MTDNDKFSLFVIHFSVLLRFCRTTAGAILLVQELSIWFVGEPEFAQLAKNCLAIDMLNSLPVKVFDDALPRRSKRNRPIVKRSRRQIGIAPQGVDHLIAYRIAEPFGSASTERGDVPYRLLDRHAGAPSFGALRSKNEGMVRSSGIVIGDTVAVMTAGVALRL